MHENMKVADIYKDKIIPSKLFSDIANVNLNNYNDIYSKSKLDYQQFWANLAKDYIIWDKEFSQVLNQDNFPFCKWFEDGYLNVSYNCLDRHLQQIPDKIAIIYESDNQDTVTITYKELYHYVCKLANSLKSIGIKKGDRVIIYLSSGIEAIVAMQACARIGAIHSVVFAGFSAKAISDRILDANAKLVITADEYVRAGKKILLGEEILQSLTLLPDNCIIPSTIIFSKNSNNNIKDKFTSKIYDWMDLIANQLDHCPPTSMNSEDPLFILYTSGSTGKPKGIVHANAGYLLGTIVTMKWVFDYKNDDVFWCSADVGWITGHSYICYGPLALGATQVIYDGTPIYPNANRYWQIIEKYKVNVFYTAPTAIRILMKEGYNLPHQHDLSSLRLLGSVGEPINPEAWSWYYEYVGNKKCPIVDTWWQTETGCNILAPLPGVTGLKPGSCTKAIFGLDVVIVDDRGNELGFNESGYLVIKNPFPSQIRTIWGNDEGFKNVYYPIDIAKGKYYVSGDNAYLDHDGYYWILGRIDDVINIAGHRIGTMEIESILSTHSIVAEVAVVGVKNEIKGEGLFVFIVAKDDDRLLQDNQFRFSKFKELEEYLIEKMGKIAKPDKIKFVKALPKTRSGKIMRRLLRSIVNNQTINQDLSTLDNLAILDDLKAE
jgi:acetyl-CoA synthetase